MLLVFLCAGIIFKGNIFLLALFQPNQHYCSQNHHLYLFFSLKILFPVNILYNKDLASPIIL